jgi:hypothetical protein
MEGKERDRVAAAAEKSNRRPIHHSPVFWIGILLCLAAIIIYVCLTICHGGRIR